MKRVILGLIAALALLTVSAPAIAHGPRYGVRVYGGYPAYAAYRPYYGPVYYPPPRVYYPPPYPVYPAPVVSGFYGGPGFGFYFGR
jgi:hypothetical protein